MRIEARVLRSLFLVLSFTLSSFTVPTAHDRISTKVTWDREIAPIVQRRCISCHSPGGRAPMPLTTYDEVRPWAKAIKEEVLARRMPKWHVVRGYGDFTNDPSLSAFEVALVAGWADGGAPRSLPGSSASAAQVPVVGPAAITVASRRVPVECTAGSLPAGRLVGLKPALGTGESLRLTLVQADGSQEPLLWVRDFDPAFAETYWLRNPITITSATRIRADAPPSCSFTALLAAGTGK